MRFYVVDPIDPEWPTAPVEAPNFVDAPNVASVMWVPLPRSVDPTQLDFFVANAPSFVLRSDVTIIGLPPGSAELVLNNSQTLDNVSRRIEGATLLTLHHDSGSPVISYINGPRIRGLETQTTVECVRDRDVAHVLRRPGAELPKHHGLHYEGPNGDHYEAFLRPGFAPRSIEDLDRLAFWLTPMLLDASCILVDHWSMISIAYHIGRYRFDLGRNGPIKVESLRGYDEDPDVLTTRIATVFGAAKPNAGAVLVSVNSSGRLVRDVLLPAMTGSGFVDPVAIALAGTPSPPDYRLPALTRLSDDFARWHEADCPACQMGDSSTIPIQKDSYLLNLAAYVQLTRITRDAAKSSADFVKRYRNIGAFQVHRTHSDGRHHAYFIDLLPILECDAFRSRLSGTMRPWRRVHIDLIIHPNHAAGQRLAEMVAKELGVHHVFAIDERDLGGQNEHAALLAAHRICLVDDVVISGARIFGYRRALDNALRRTGHAYELYCLVGVTRMRNEKAVMSVADMVHHTDTHPRFLSVERLFLPNWQERDCRWCAELRMLNEVPDDIQGRPLVHSRIDALRNADGLVDGLFLPWRGDETHQLGPGSIFGDVQDADLALSVAGAIQRLRGSRFEDGTWLESHLDEVFHPPLAKILDPQFYLAGRFYDPVLVAAILRGSKVHDIRAPGEDATLRERIEIVAKADRAHELHGELTLAAALDQLPRPQYKLPQAHPDIWALVQALWDTDSRSSGRRLSA